ncbi:MAG TPA: S8 family serine peptidase [Steroidobacteraceae bacterium]|nr:S8 family serine peptidase [Steroidobacteraceae bacterium]
MSPTAPVSAARYPARWRRTTALLLILAAGPLEAQLQLPTVPVPLPPGHVIDAATQALSGTSERLLDAITGARSAAARALIRKQRAYIEADPDGAPIVRAELLAFDPGAAALSNATAMGFEILRRETLAGLAGELVTLRAPPRMSTRVALAQLRRIDPAGDYDYNHIYLPSGAGDETAAPVAGAAAQAPPPTGPRLGMIDSGLDLTHPALAQSHARQSGCSGPDVPAAHGTAVASLMVGSDANFHGALPGAQLIAIDVYCTDVTGGSTDRVALAFASLVNAGVSVINVSLVGPRNATLARVVAAVQARGVLIVAAVGNDGPAAPPLYPAALPGVIAVTGVDARGRVLPEAGRGEHVMFAAPGAELRAADLKHGYATVRGTSYAAPIVAGLLAAALGPPPDASAQALRSLIAASRDLGARGRDPVYGYGLVGESLRSANSR